MRWSGRPFLAAVVAALTQKLWPENFPGIPADCRGVGRKEGRQLRPGERSVILANKEKNGAWFAEMKVVCQGNHWTEKEATATQEDKTALMEGVSL